MKLLTALVTMTVTAVRAVPMNDYCMGCLTSMEAMFLLSRESKIANRDLPPITDIAAMLCFSEYFDLFNDFIKEGCQHMLKSNPDRFKRAIEQAVEIEVDSAAHAAKLVYFDFAKEQCENQFNACDKNTFKRFPKQSDRNDCMACQIVIDEMSAFTRAIPSTNASHVMRTVCPSLGYKNQPGSWLEDACFEIIDEHAGALTKLFSSPKALDAAVICSGLDVGCPKKTKEL